MTFLLCVMYILLFALVTIINYLLTYLLTYSDIVIGTGIVDCTRGRSQTMTMTMNDNEFISNSHI